MLAVAIAGAAVLTGLLAWAAWDLLARARRALDGRFERPRPSAPRRPVRR